MVFLLVFFLGYYCIFLKIGLDLVNWNNVIFIIEFFFLEYFICLVLVRIELDFLVVR